MRTFEVTLYGTITRDIRRYEIDAETEEEARRVCALEKPGYRLHEIKLKLEPTPSQQKETEGR